MSVYLHQLKNVPEFLKASFADHTILAIIGLVLFVLALVFTHRLATDLRYVVVIVLIALLIFAWVFKKYTLFWSAALGLLIMFVVRFIMWAIKTGRQNRINRRIEERALAKAAARRGNWQNKKGYSGASRPIHREYNNTVMSKAEIN
ncbi:MAG: hypothetical protein KBS83_05620, partial [Lachnospiraceae bacterium]|nr:hypothetical protein [Candidatus Equihabitans merdae]